MRNSSISQIKILALKLSLILKKGDFLLLYGNIGTGKTTLARYIINNIQKKNKKRQTEIPSPTFNIAFEYNIKNFIIRHFDLYRLKKSSELKNIGFCYIVARGQKSYNGVAIISKVPIKDMGSINYANLDHARHVSAVLENGITIHNHYIPAGGDIPDRKVNEKFGQKLDYLDHLMNSFKKKKPVKSILVGDLNIAPYEDDVWSHKQLIKVVSHTPIEIESLLEVKKSGDWVDIIRKLEPDGKLYSWWSYRARDWLKADRGRRLDHIWATNDIASYAKKCYTLKEARGWDRPSDHAPVFTIYDI